MKVSPRVLRIARDVRRCVVRRARREGQPKNLEGLCLRASYMLDHALTRAGFKARCVEGLFEEAGHCWVQVGRYIVDITATQFDERAVLVVGLRDKRYVEMHDFPLVELAPDEFDRERRQFPGWYSGTPKPEDLRAVERL